MSAPLCVVCALALAAGLASAQQWQAQWQPDRSVEDLRPRAAVVKSADATLEVRDGLLVFDIPIAKSSAFLGIGTNPPVAGGESAVMGDATAWDGRKPTTVEARLRVVRPLPDDDVVAQVYVGDGDHGWLLQLTKDGPPGLALNATDFHTYRITLKQGIANLYVDGQLAPEASLVRMTYPRNGLLVGDISSSVGGLSEWEHVRWTNAEATPWEASEEAMRRVEKLLVVTGDQDGDVEWVNVSPPFGEVATLSDGRILSWYPAPKQVKHTPGESEAAVDDPGFTERAWGRVSEDDGRAWGDPQVLFEFPKGAGAHLDGMALVTRSGALHLWGLHFFLCPLKAPFDYSQFHSDLWHARSLDDGKTWDPVQKVDFGYAYTGASNSAIELSTGRILVPISRYSDRPTGRFVTCVPYSDDDGVTWQRPVDEVIVDTGGGGLESGACEPVAAELKDGRVWMLIRAQDGFQWETFSTDGGLHWSAPRHSRFVCSNSPVAMLRLEDGRLLVIWNNCGTGQYNRLLLCAAITADEGKTWTGYREIARRAEDGVYSYPYVTEARDGKVIVVLLQGQRMLRLDPDFLTRTTLRDDFTQGLGKWSQLGTEGARAVADPDGGEGKVLRLAKPKAEVPAGVCLNFPFGVQGDITLQIRTEPGFQGAHFALDDHYDMPGLPQEGTFAWRVTTESQLEASRAEGSFEPGEALLTPGAWHELRVSWDCAGRAASISVDGKPAGESLQLSDRPGVCYLRLRSLAAATDEAGLYVRSVQVEVRP